MRQIPYLRSVFESLRWPHPLPTIAFCLAGLLQPMQLGAQTQFATAIVRVVDGDGNPLDYHVDSFHAIDQPDVELAQRFRGTTISGIKLGGSYLCVISVKIKQARPLKEQAIIAVNNLNTVAVLAVAVTPSVDFATPPVTRFVVKPSPSVDGQPTWVAVRPAFATVPDPFFRIEATIIDPLGRFELQGKHLGLYLVTLYRSNTVLATKTIEIPYFGTLKGKDIEIRLE